MDKLHNTRTKRFLLQYSRIYFYLAHLLLWNLSSNILSAQSDSKLSQSKEKLKPLQIKYTTANTYPEFRTNDVLTEEFIQQCLLYLGTTEQPKGSNWGEDIKNMLASVGIYFEAAWCAGFTGIANRNSCIPYPISGYVPNWSRGVWKEKVVWDKVQAKRTILPSEVRRGDQCTIYFSNLGRDAHIFVVLGVTEKGNLITIEGNTNPSGGRDGWGVFIRVRELWQVSKVIRLIEN